MKSINTIIILLGFVTVLLSFKQHEPSFIGKISYNNTFTDLKGNDVNEQLEPYFGRQVFYYIDKKNYKGYNEKSEWSYLYNSATTTYFSFDNKNKIATKYDATVETNTNASVNKLSAKQVIAGYDCDAIRITTDKTITTFFYSPKIKIDYQEFANHAFGDWNVFLKATNGALPLKFILENRGQGYIWTNEATEIVQMNLTDKDFVIPTRFKVRSPQFH